jgi:tetratricopeptide (TPR) repeat protein
MRILAFFVLIILFAPLGVVAQNRDKLTQLYINKKFDEAIVEGKRQIVEHINDNTTYLIIGRSFVDIGQFDSSIAYLVEAIRIDSDRTWISSWGHAYLGNALLRTGNVDLGVSELNKCLSQNKTPNSTAYAQKLLLSQIDVNVMVEEMGLIKIETESILYYIQDTEELPVSLHRYIAEHDSAYTELKRIFKSQLQHKLEFFVFTQKRKSEKALKRKLGFSLPEAGRCFSLSYQTLAHEMTHVISYWSLGIKPKSISRFINEGVAVCFDMSRSNLYLKASVAAKEYSIKKSVLEVWASDRDFPDEFVYPFSGAFIHYLYSHVSSDVFEAFIKDQSISNLKGLLKSDFDIVISDFDRKIAEVNQ